MFATIVPCGCESPRKQMFNSTSSTFLLHNFFIRRFDLFCACRLLKTGDRWVLAGFACLVTDLSNSSTPAVMIVVSLI